MPEDVHHVSNAIPNAPYSRHPPSPPFIAIASTHDYFNDRIPDLLPSIENIDPTELSAEQVEIITGNKVQVADTGSTEWVYEKRREAQRILDFLYLGPSNVIRDHAFLKREGITLLLIAREARMVPPRLMSADKAVQALGIEAAYVEIDSWHNLVKAFTEANHIINAHILNMYKHQARQQAEKGQDALDPTKFRRGKVLIACETGNDRSAAIAAAYIMSTYGTKMENAIRFLSAQRFCCCWEEETKRKLQSWEDITKARSQVAAAANGVGEDHHKRGFDDTMDIDDEESLMPIDQDRFMGREAFTPFRDAEN